MRHSSKQIRFTCVLALAVFIAGCSSWKSQDVKSSPQKNGLLFSNKKMKPNSVAIEMAVAQFDDQQRDELRQLWRQLDQQILPIEIRKLLDQNGFRVAIVPSNVPAIMQQVLEPIPIDPEKLDEVQLHLYNKGHLSPKSRLVTSVRRQVSRGQSMMLNVSPEWPEMNWVLHDGRRQMAGAGTSVQGVFELISHPLGNGSVRIEINPRIFHGQERTRIGVTDGEFVYQPDRDFVNLRPLRFEVRLQPGQSLLIGPTEDLEDLGQLFFSAAERMSDPVSPLQFEPNSSIDLADLDQLAIQLDESETDGSQDHDSMRDIEESSGAAPEPQPKPSHRVLLIRVVQTQQDDLFSLKPFDPSFTN